MMLMLPVLVGLGPPFGVSWICKTTCSFRIPATAATCIVLCEEVHFTAMVDVALRQGGITGAGLTHSKATVVQEQHPRYCPPGHCLATPIFTSFILTVLIEVGGA